MRREEGKNGMAEDRALFGFWNEKGEPIGSPFSFQQLSYYTGRSPSATTSATSRTLVWPACLSLRPSSNMVMQ